MIAAAAGGIAGAGTAAAGAGVSTNNIGDTVTADVTGGNIQSGGDFNLSATFTRPASLPIGLNAQISSLAVGGAISGTVSIAGAVTTNEIHNLVAADASGGAIIGATGAINLSSSDNSSIDSIAGQGSISGSVAVGAAVAYNDLGSTIRASGSAATLNAGTSLSIQAQSTAGIETIAVGLSASIDAGVAGSVAVNRTHDTIEASLKNGSNATAQNNATLQAIANNSTQTYGGTLGVGIAGIGGTVVIDSVNNSTQAFVDSSTVHARGLGGTVGVPNWDNSGTESTDNMRGLAVISSAQESITDRTVSGGAGIVGVGINVAVNKVTDTTQAYINSSNINSAADNGQSVKVRAHQGTTIDDAGGVLGVGAVGVGAVVDTTVLASITKALVEGSSKVYAGGGLTVATVTNENAQIITAGAAAAGVAVAGGASVVKSTSTNEAGVLDSTVTATGDLDVTAANQDQATLYSGTISGGVVAGAGGAIVVALLGDSVTAHIVGSTTSATGTTLVDAIGNDTINTLAGAGGLGGMAGIAGAVSVSEDTSSTTAAIDSDSNVAHVNSQSVNVLATDSVSVNDNDGSVGLGLGAGAGASVDVISVTPSIDAYLGNGVTVNASGNVEVEATGTKNVSSTVVSFAGGLAAGVEGSVAVIGVGIGLDGQGESQATPMQSSVDGQIGLSGGVQGLDTSNAIASAAQNDSKTSLSIDGALSTTQTPEGTAAFIGTGATVTAGGSVTVQAQETETINATVGGVAVGIASIGGSVVVVNLGNLTQAYLGSSSVVSAGGSVTVQATFNDTGNATAEAGQGGLISLGAQVALVTDNSSESAWTGSGTQIIQSSGVTFNASATRDVDTGAKFLGIGGVVAGAGVAKSIANGSTQAYLGSNDLIGQQSGKSVGSLSISATSTDTVGSRTDGISVSAAGFQANESVSNDNPHVVAAIGGGSQLTTTGDVGVVGTASGRVNAETDNVNVGLLVSSGVMESYANYTPYVESYVGTAAGVNAGGNFTLSDNSSNLNGAASAKAETSGGGVFSGQGTLAESTSTSTDLAHIEAGASVTAGNNLTVSATGSNAATSDAEGSSGGLISAASVISSSTVGSETLAETDDATANTPTYLNATGTIAFTATSTNTISNAYTNGGSGGLVGSGDAESSAVDNDPLTQARLGNYTIINNASDAGLGHLVITADNNADIESSANQTVIGGIANNSTSSTAQINGSQTFAQVGQNSSANVNAIDITADDQSVYSYANAVATVGDVFGNNAAHGYADLNGNVQTHIYPGVNLIAAGNVNITASVDSAQTSSNTNCTSYGVDGNLTSIAESTKNDTANVTADAGASITGQDVTVTSTVSQNQEYNKNDTLNADTLVAAVTKTVVAVIEAVLRVVSLDGFLFNYHRTASQCASAINSALGSREDQGTPGTQNLSNSIVFNANVTIDGPPSPNLQIDSTGHVTQDVGVSATDGTHALSVGSVVSSGEVVVNNLSFTNPNELSLQTPGGALSGRTTVTYGISFSSINIVNQSPSMLYLNNISAYTDTIDANIVTSASSKTWSYGLTTALGNTVIDIENTNRSGGSITLLGHILNPGGKTTVHAAAGNIVSTGSGSYINTRLAYLLADQGAIGSASQVLVLDLNNGASELPASLQEISTPIALEQASSSTGVYLDISLVSIQGAPTMTIQNVTATTGNISIKLENAYLDGTSGQNQINLSNGTSIVGTEMLDTFNPSTAVDPATGIITLPFAHDFYSGEPVTYENGSGNSIGGLDNGNTYTLQVLSPTSVELVDNFDPSSAVDWSNDTIVFGSPDGLNTGDQLIYENNGATSIGGLTNGQTYYVRVIDPYTIKLAATAIDAGVPFAFSASAVDGTQNTIQFASADGMATGQPLTYTSTGLGLTGLALNTVYYAIVVNSTTIRLADSVADAKAGTYLAIAPGSARVRRS